MKTLWNSSNYNNDIKLTYSDALILGEGDCTPINLSLVMAKPYVKKQIKNLDPVQLKKELKGFGAWDDIQLENHNDNIERWLWLSAGDIIERNHYR